MIKPDLNIRDVQELLVNLRIVCEDIHELHDGQIARTFYFDSMSKTYFLQFTEENMSQGTINEILFRDEFESRNVPIRRIVSHGDYKGYRYLITEKAKGKSYDLLSPEEFLKALPHMMNVLYQISETNICDSSGYGWIDEKGDGKSDSWLNHLEFIYQEEPGCFYGYWFDLFEKTFLEKSKYDYYFKEMKALFKYIPSIRKLVHSGYCGGNILFEENRVTAVMDWQDAKYGDPLYDLAYTIFWLDDDKARVITDAYLKAFGLNEEEQYFYERIKCYQYYIGLDCMRYSAKINNKEFYDFVLSLLERLK